MEEEVTPEMLKRATGKKVEVIAFGISYRGRLEKVDLRRGTIRVVDGKNAATLEIERIEFFAKL